MNKVGNLDVQEPFNPSKTQRISTAHWGQYTISIFTTNVNRELNVNARNFKDLDVQDNKLNETNYQTHFPKISTNFERNVTKAATNRMEQTPANVANFQKKDQTPELVPYTVIQNYADMLRFNQLKNEIRINLTEPEITTKQGLPAILYVKKRNC